MSDFLFSAFGTNYLLIFSSHASQRKGRRRKEFENFNFDPFDVDAALWQGCRQLRLQGGRN